MSNATHTSTVHLRRVRIAAVALAASLAGLAGGAFLLVSSMVPNGQDCITKTMEASQVVKDPATCITHYDNNVAEEAAGMVAVMLSAVALGASAGKLSIAREIGE